MTKMLIAAGAVLMLAVPALATSQSLTTQSSNQQAKKPATSTTVSDGRTLSDYNIQKE